MRQALKDVPGVAAALIYGSVAKGRERLTSDIDVFILGKPDRNRLAAVLQEAEWQARHLSRDAFVKELLRSPKIFLLGDDNVLPRPEPDRGHDCPTVLRRGLLDAVPLDGDEDFRGSLGRLFRRSR